MRARCVRKVAHPAPEIELESCDANADRVAGIGDRTHFGNANRRTWRAAASHIAVGAERRQPFGNSASARVAVLKKKKGKKYKIKAQRDRKSTRLNSSH